MVSHFFKFFTSALQNSHFSDYGASKIVSHFFKFFTFSYFCGTFVKNIMKKYQFLIQTYKFHFKIYFFYKVLRSQTCCYYNSGPFNITQNFGKKAVFINVLTRILLETLCKNYLFVIPISKGRIRIYYIGEFQDLKVSATKMTAVSI